MSEKKTVEMDETIITYIIIIQLNLTILGHTVQRICC